MLGFQISRQILRMGFQGHVIRCVEGGVGDAKEIQNEEVKEAKPGWKDAHEVMCQNSTEENKNKHKLFMYCI